MRCFETFAFEKYHDLETWVSGHSRSLKMTPFERSHMTFYQRSIVTIALPRTIFDVLDLKNTVT